jgi:hypothetical protein
MAFAISDAYKENIYQMGTLKPIDSLLRVKKGKPAPEPIPIKTGYSWMDELVALHPASARSSDFPALVRANLENLGEQMKDALQRGEDSATKVHLKDCLKGIDLILNPKN